MEPETMALDRSQDNVEAAPEPGSTERAFARGSGFVFQTVGVVLLLASIGVLCAGGLVPGRTTETPTRWLDQFHGESRPFAIFSACAWFGVVGGLAVATAGLGLQAERTDAARFGMVAGTVWAVGYWTASVLLIARGRHWVYALLPALLGLVMVFLVALAHYSRAVLRRFPPPSDRNIVTDEVLEQWRTEGEKRREHQT